MAGDYDIIRQCMFYEPRGLCCYVIMYLLSWVTFINMNGLKSLYV